MRFELEIVLGNDAMQTTGDVAGALRNLANRLDYSDHGPDFAARIRDDNGTTVGSCRVSDESGSDLESAARAVVDAWEAGDLAGAVRNLADAI